MQTPPKFPEAQISTHVLPPTPLTPGYGETSKIYKTDRHDFDEPPLPPLNLFQKPADKKEEDLWNDLNRLYYENEEVIQRASTTDAEQLARDNKVGELNDAIDGFLETAKTVSECLIVLGNVHPAIGLAVFAFHTVISLDITRRDNSKKALAVKIQMQNMMCALFQLRKLRYAHIDEVEKATEKGRMQRFISTIAEEIRSCGSDLSYYRERKFVSKLINSKTYERRFADHIVIFAQRRSELQTIITAYIAGGIDAANQGIREVGRKVQQVDAKLNTIIDTLLRKLDTPKEEEVLKFLTENGGPEKCLAKDELLVKLLTKAGDHPPSSQKNVGIRNDDLIKRREELTAELKEDLEEILRHNLGRFEAMMKVQNNNLQRISDQLHAQGAGIFDQTRKLDQLLTYVRVLDKGTVVEKVVLPRSLDKIVIKDPILQQIWDRMGLKRNVKAKTFVLSLRDHLLSDHTNPNSHQPTPNLNTSGLPNGSLFSPTIPSNNLAPVPSHNIKIDEVWALQFIDASHVQPILEAIDEDFSGFISVQEANRFALSRPPGCSLEGWLAYWGAGWHINLSSWKTKIYSIVQAMHETLLTPHPANRSYVDRYLNNPSVNRIDNLLRSTKSLPDDASKDSRLAELSEKIAARQEERLAGNLKDMAYLVSSPQDVPLMTGGGRIEVWIYPLLRILLKRHLDIIKLSCKRVLHEDELDLHTQSITNIFTVFDERMNILDAIFRQMDREVERRFQTFAYGMFLESFLKKDRTPANNALLTFKDDTIISSKFLDPDDIKSVSDDPTILSQGLGPTFEYKDIKLESSDPPEGHKPHPVEGSWTGQCLRATQARIAFQGFFQCTIDPIVDGKITGRGETYLGEVIIQGKVRLPGDEEPFVPVFDDDDSDDDSDEDDEAKGSDEGKPELLKPGSDVDAQEKEGDDDSDIGVEEKEDAAGGGAGEDEDGTDVAVVKNGDAVNPAQEHSLSDDGSETREEEEKPSPIQTQASSLDQPPPAVIYIGASTPSTRYHSVEHIATEAMTRAESPLIKLDFYLISPIYANTHCKGTYDPVSETIVGQWAVDRGDSPFPDDDHEQEEETDMWLPCGRFRMTHTPASVFRFRQLLEKPIDPETVVAEDETKSSEGADVNEAEILLAENKALARRRWSFVCQAILFQTRNRLGTASFFSERTAERRRWLELTIRREWDKAHIGPFRSPMRQLSEGLQAELWTLRLEMHPSNGRLYDSLALYLYNRNAWTIGAYMCDACSRTIIQTRHQCIDCMTDELNDEIDFCETCVDKTIDIPDKDFNHTTSHSLIRSRHLIPECELPVMIPQSRLRSERIKFVFRALDAKKAGKSLNDNTDETQNRNFFPGYLMDPDPFCCACCQKEVTLPCWVCAVCALDTFICCDCDTSRLPVRRPDGFTAPHSFDHPLMLMKSNDEVKPRPSKPASTSKLEKQFQDMERQVNITLAELQSKVDSALTTKVAELETKFAERMTVLENNVERKMDCMLGLLQQMATSMALPSSSTIREVSN